MPDIIPSSARRSTPGGIPYTLFNGYPKIKVESEYTATATEVYLINAGDLDALISELMPTPELIDGEYQFIPRYFMPGTTFLSFSSMDAESHSPELPCDPFGADPRAPEGTYEPMMAVTIEYKAGGEDKKDKENPESFLNRSRETTVELLTLQGPAQNTKVGDPPVGIKNPVTPITKVIPITNWDMEWERVMFPNFKTWDALTGTVNKQSYSWLGNVPAETVLFLGASAKQDFQYIGNRTIVKPWKVTLKFATKWIVQEAQLPAFPAADCGWNHIYNPDSHRFERVTRIVKPGDAQVPLYDLADFMDLFKPAT